MKQIALLLLLTVSTPSVSKAHSNKIGNYDALYKTVKRAVEKELIERHYIKSGDELLSTDALPDFSIASVAILNVELSEFPGKDLSITPAVFDGLIKHCRENDQYNQRKVRLGCMTRYLRDHFSLES